MKEPIEINITGIWSWIILALALGGAFMLGRLVF